MVGNILIFVYIFVAQGGFIEVYEVSTNQFKVIERLLLFKQSVIHDIKVSAVCKIKSVYFALVSLLYLLTCKAVFSKLFSNSTPLDKKQSIKRPL